MKKIILVLTMLTLTTAFASNDDSEVEIMTASEDYVMSLVQVCKEYATEDETSQDELKRYLLVCINDELESSFYAPIKALPKMVKLDD